MNKDEMEILRNLFKGLHLIRLSTNEHHIEELKSIYDNNQNIKYGLGDFDMGLRMVKKWIERYSADLDKYHEKRKSAQMRELLEGV